MSQHRKQDLTGAKRLADLAGYSKIGNVAYIESGALRITGNAADHDTLRDLRATRLEIDVLEPTEKASRNLRGVCQECLYR